MNKNKDQLDFNIKDIHIDPEKIVKKVNDNLNCDTEERRIYLKRKFTKGVLVAAALIALLSTTVFAAINLNILKLFFEGDTTSMDDYVQSPKQSVTDGYFTFTLEQVLSTKNQAFIVYSIEALTDEAVNELMDDSFTDMDTISFKPVEDYSRLNFSGYGQSEIMDKRTETKKYFALSCEDMYNKDESDFVIRLNKMKKPQDILVSMKTNIETTEFIFKGQTYGDAVVQITPLGLNFIKYIEKNSKSLFDSHLELNFRMANDEIKTFNQLLELKSGVLLEEGDVYNRYKISALFREITPLTEFKSIILGSIEYDIEDLSKTKPFELEEKLQPFTMKPFYKEHLWIPIQELCDNLGAEYEWDDNSKTFSFTYRNQSYVITPNSDKILLNGETISFYEGLNDQKAFIQDEKLYVSYNLALLMKIRCNVVNFYDQQGNLIDAKDWIWQVIP